MNLTIGHLGCHCCRHYKYSRNFLDQLWKHSGSNPIMQSAHLYSHHHHLIIRNKKLQESIILPRNLIRNLQFFIVKGFRGCKRTKEKCKFAIHSSSCNNLNDHLNVNNYNNDNDCKSSITINHSWKKWYDVE